MPTEHDRAAAELARRYAEGGPHAGMHDAAEFWAKTADKLPLVLALLERDRRAREALGHGIQVIEQLLPEPNARGVADLVLFEMHAALAWPEDTDTTP